MNEFINELKAEVKTSSELAEEKKRKKEAKERVKLIEEVMRKREEEVWEK